MTLQLPKGTRDLKQEEAIVKDKIVGTLKKVFEVYGYNPLETPVFERYDILASKYAGGAEILKETFKFKDQGQRDLALRYDLTVPMCRFVGMNPNIKLPFKRYAIGEVFRDGPVEKARYRQFTQCDIDVVGIKGMTADAEIIALTQRAFKKLGFDAVIKVNNRKLLNDLLLNANVKKDKLDTAILSIDKLNKFGLEAVKKELKEKKVDDETINKITTIIDIKGSNDEKIDKIKRLVKESEGTAEIEELISLLAILKVNVDFDVSLARGLSYYTGTVIEVYLKDSAVKSAVCAGGRYDKMIGSFLGKGDYPAVGISFGLDRVYDAYIEKTNETKKSVTQVYIIPINTFNESLKIAEELRNENVNIDIDLTEKGPSKNLKYANSLGIPYVLFVGEEELKQGKVKLKDMNSGKEQLMSAEELVVFLNKNLE
ncbi:histidine--tRNA ligase [Candidatus Woesearchaeota archaeon]|jgi:histidyl-tRNA synthetase|nr:histidine--tRNA ligase [Candidatus Woesearchaeota archaeon]|tara:strand:- start:656 stop:1939 length:1284 start_codon:yes stop_codon:yes gene_type:complete